MLPNTGITSTIVANELGSGSNRAWSYLCKHININRWSFYKPVSYPTSTGITYDQIKAARFGIPTPNPSTVFTEASAREYIYIKPSGGANSPYRIGDFRYYSHGAIPPCSSTGNISVNLSLAEKVFIPSMNFGGGDAISMDEFLDLKDLYVALGITYTYGGSSYTTYKTASNTLETRTSSVTYNLKQDLPFSLGSSISNLKYYWVAASNPRTGTSEPSQQLFYALPFNTPSDSSGYITTSGGGSELQFIPSGIMNYLTAEYVDNIKDYQNDDIPRYFRMANDGTIYIEFTVRNNQSTEKTVSLKNSTAVARPSFSRSQPAPTTGTVNVYWYYYENMKWNERASITVQPGATATLRLGVDGWLSYKDGVQHAFLDDGKQANTSINITVTNGKIPPFIVNLRA